MRRDLICPCCGAENPFKFILDYNQHVVIGCDECLTIMDAAEYLLEKEEEECTN